MNKILSSILIFVSLNACAADPNRPKPSVKPQMIYQGISLPGAEFKAQRLPGVHDKDYKWPTKKNFQQMKAAGFNTVRVPFLWDRIQPRPLGELSGPELLRLDKAVVETAEQQLNIVLDVHNYGRYSGRYLTNSPDDIEVFIDLWHRLSLRYKKHPHVIFALMNEPNRQAVNVWYDLAQAAVNAIRKNGANQLILIPGTSWTGMHSWFYTRAAGSNASAMLNIKDPMNNYAYEMHQYFDSDYSGMHSECVDSKRFVSQFNKTSEWLRANQKKAFLGEFGATLTPKCIDALKVTMNTMMQNRDVWIGWTYWATSDWMKTYMFNIFTDNPQDPRLNIIKETMKTSSGVSGNNQTGSPLLPNTNTQPALPSGQGNTPSTNPGSNDKNRS